MKRRRTCASSMIPRWIFVLLVCILLGFVKQACSYPTPVVGTNTERATISPVSQINKWNQCRYDSNCHQRVGRESFPLPLESKFTRKVVAKARTTTTTTLRLGANTDNEKSLSVGSYYYDDNEQQQELHENILQVAIEASKKAGTIIATNCNGADVVERKSTNRDLLTLVDPLCEKVRRPRLYEFRFRFPDIVKL